MKEETQPHPEPQTFWQHLKDWNELYLVLPLSILGITLANYYYFAQTGRSPTIAEGGIDWLLGMVPRLVAIVLSIIMVSVFKQATGVWLSKEESLANWKISVADKIGRCFILWLFIKTLTS